jgi:Pectinacetylesterase
VQNGVPWTTVAPVSHLGLRQFFIPVTVPSQGVESPAPANLSVHVNGLAVACANVSIPLLCRVNRFNSYEHNGYNDLSVHETYALPVEGCSADPDNDDAFELVMLNPAAVLGNEYLNQTGCLAAGSSYGFYIRRATSLSKSLKWVIFLEGSGGACSSPNHTEVGAAVLDEWTTTTNTTTVNSIYGFGARWGEGAQGSNTCSPSKLESATGNSHAWTLQRTSNHNVLSRNDELNYWAGWNHIILPYCSQDTWVGRADQWIQGQQYRFRGRSNLEGTLTWLRKHVGDFANATEVLFAGESAGAIGVLHFIKQAELHFANSTFSSTPVGIRYLLFDPIIAPIPAVPFIDVVCRPWATMARTIEDLPAFDGYRDVRREYEKMLVKCITGLASGSNDGGLAPFRKAWENQLSITYGLGLQFWGALPELTNGTNTTTLDPECTASIHSDSPTLCYFFHHVLDVLDHSYKNRIMVVANLLDSQYTRFIQVTEPGCAAYSDTVCSSVARSWMHVTAKRLIEHAHLGAIASFALLDCYNHVHNFANFSNDTTLEHEGKATSIHELVARWVNGEYIHATDSYGALSADVPQFPLRTSSDRPGHCATAPGWLRGELGAEEARSTIDFHYNYNPGA